MSPELVMYLCRMNSLVAQMEAMKADNAKCEVYGETPQWSGDHFNGVASDLDKIASSAGSCIS